jgi:excisionase family DNA binding protein
MEQDILNLDEAVIFLKTSKPTFYRWLGQGRIKGFKMGREWRFYKSDLISYMESSDQETELYKKELRRLNEFFSQRLEKKNIKPD